MREIAEWRASLPEIQLIFEGKVSAQELKAGNLNSAVRPLSLTTTGRYRIVHLTANHIYRGPAESEIILRTGLGTSDCGYPFETGATYLVYYGIRIRVTATDGTRFSYKNGCGVAIHSPKSDALSYQVSHVLQEDGSYTFGYIPAGPYTVTTYFQPNYEDPERRLFPEASRWKPVSREIVVRGDTDVEIQMEPSKN